MTGREGMVVAGQEADWPLSSHTQEAECEQQWGWATKLKA